MQIRVYYEDTDFSGIVYHANYLRFMERGRTNHLRLMGAEQHALFAEARAETPGFAFVVRSMHLDYLKPARMDDVLDATRKVVAAQGYVGEVKANVEAAIATRLEPLCRGSVGRLFGANNSTPSLEKHHSRSIVCAWQR